ncbi:MAG: archaellin/type IV pilin N-terminal domain-containing protein, partial [Candidatus Aenigmatarchaeota archaeon]
MGIFSGLGSGRRKGVSPVIATLLLVMITVVLVAFVNDFLNQLTQEAQGSTQKVLIRNEQMSQRFSIPTAYGCGGYICFEIKALGTNEYSIPTENSGYYINDVPKNILPWTDGPSGLE